MQLANERKKFTQLSNFFHRVVFKKTLKNYISIKFVMSDDFTRFLFYLKMKIVAEGKFKRFFFLF